MIGEIKYLRNKVSKVIRGIYIYMKVYYNKTLITKPYETYKITYGCKAYGKLNPLWRMSSFTNRLRSYGTFHIAQEER